MRARASCSVPRPAAGPVSGPKKANLISTVADVAAVVAAVVGAAVAAAVVGATVDVAAAAVVGAAVAAGATVAGAVVGCGAVVGAGVAAGAQAARIRLALTSRPSHETSLFRCFMGLLLGERAIGTSSSGACGRAPGRQSPPGLRYSDGPCSKGPCESCDFGQSAASGINSASLFWSAGRCLDG